MKKLFFSLLLFVYSLIMQSQNPSFQWAQLTGSITVLGLCTDQNANIYSTGYFIGTNDFNPGIGTYTLTSAGSQDIFVSKFDSSGNFIWAKKIGGTLQDMGNSISLDKFGNIYITGFFQNIVDFNFGPGVLNLSTPANSSSIFVMKVDTSGNFIWAKNMAGNKDSEPHGIAIDNFGNVYTTGLFVGTVDFDPGAGVCSMTTVGPTGDFDAYISKLDTSGNFVWAKQIGGTTSQNLYSIGLDKIGNVYVAGYFIGTTDFDPGIGVFNYTSMGSSDICVLKLNSSGNFMWAKQMGGTSYEVANDIAVDSIGNTYTGGRFNQTVDFDPNGSVYNLTSATSNYDDSFISKLDSSGNFIWAKRIGGNLTDVINKVILDKVGNLYIMAGFQGLVDVDPGTGTYYVNSPYTLHLLKLNSAGNFDWVFNSPADKCLVIDPFNNIITAGILYNTADFDPGFGVFNLTPTGSYESFYLKLNQSCIGLAVPSNIIPGPNQAVCINSSVSLSATSTGIVNWYSSPTSNISLSTGSIFAPTLAAGSYTFYAEASACLTNPMRVVLTVTVDSTCADIWPGDANSDGIANNLDVLELGLHYTQTGAPRASTSNNWQSYFANNWTGTITNGKNVNHSDCNGDGIINDNDTLAIYNNYGLTHAFKPAETNTVNPQFSIVPDQASVVKGTWGTASIYLGDATNQINNINGLAFTVDFDNTLIEPSSIYIEYVPSFIDAGQNLRFRKLDFANNKIYAASTHTVSNNANGFGKIATLHYQIKAALTTDQVLNLGISQANQSGASGAITPLTSGTGTLLAMGSSVGLQELNGNLISISPNPTNGSLTINSKTELQKIEVMSVDGQILLVEVPTNVSHTLHLESLATGIYFVNLYQDNRVVKREKIVLSK